MSLFQQICIAAYHVSENDLLRLFLPFPFLSPLGPAARVTRRRLETSQVVVSLPASRVDFDALEKNCPAEPHFLQSSLKKAKEYFEASCNVKVTFYAANMK